MRLIRLSGIVVLLTLCAFYPFLPGEYDGLALGLSLVAQILGAAGLLFVPIGALWLIDDARKGASRRENVTAPRNYYALAGVIVYVIVAVIVSVAAWRTGGLAFGCATLALSTYVFSKFVSRLKRVARSKIWSCGSTPLCLTAMPIVIFALQLLLADRMTEFSRARAIANSAELIDELENYHATHGRYPQSLAGVWPNYKVSVIGIEQFHYAPDGDAYNLYFEQPLPLFTAPGTREFVVYNPRDKHLLFSHAAWNLRRSPTDCRHGKDGTAPTMDHDPIGSVCNSIEPASPVSNGYGLNATLFCARAFAWAAVAAPVARARRFLVAALRCYPA
jgi:hypothetical protein